MAALILPSRQITQPQGPVQIDWSNPLTRRLAMAVVGGIPVELAAGQAASLVNSPTLDLQPGRGRAWRVSGTGRVDAPCSLLALSPGEFSIATVAAQDGWAASPQLIGMAHDGASLYPTCGLVVGDGLNIAFTWNPTNNGYTNLSAAHTFTAGQPFRISASTPPSSSSTATDGRIYVDGLRKSPSGSNNAAVANFTSRTVSIGNRSDGSRPFNGSQSLVLVWNRALSDAEHTEWARNPWQLFKPAARRLWILPPATSDSTGTLTVTETSADAATLAGSVTAAGALAATESSPDTAALASIAPTAGALAATESGTDTLAATSGATALTGSLSASEAGPDSATATAATQAQGTLTAAESGADTFGATSGATAATGTLTATETGTDTASASGNAPTTASLGAVEGAPDTAALTGLALVLGLFSAAETGTDAATASGTLGPAPAAGALAATEAPDQPDSAAISAAATATGLLAAVEAGTDSFSSVPPFRLVNASTTVLLTTDRTTVRRTLDRTTVTTT